MNPEERQLLERSLKLAEENNAILKKIQGQAKRAAVYGFIKMGLYVLPLVIGYFFLQPYINDAFKNYDNIRETLKTL